MKVSVKRLISLLVIVVMLFSLVACSKDVAIQDENVQSESEEELSGEITIWSWDVAAKSLEYAASNFKKIHPNVNIIIDDLGNSQVYDKLTTSLATNSGLPDVVTIEGERISGFAKKFPDSFVDFTSIINKDKFLSVKISEASVDNSIMAYPWDGAPAGIFYRTDLFKKAGINANDINTWSDFIDAGVKMNEIGVKMIPIAASRNDTLFRFIYNQLGGYYFDKDGNTTLNTKNAIKAMSIVKEMYDAEITYDNVNWDGLVTASKEGKVATVANAVWWAGTLQSECTETAGNWAVMPLPKASENSSTTSINGGSSLMVPKGGGNSKVASEFVKFAMTDIDSIVYSFKEYGLYPSYIPAFENEIFNEEVEYFGGQKIWKLFAELGKKVPQLNFTENFGEANDLVVDGQSRILLEDASVEETLNKLQEELVNKFGK
ncbi:MAG: extracellular solute-binding protein [Bacillota bacterium]|nr:extracellular solute-binding protein [Bacillota bacterium]